MADPAQVERIFEEAIDLRGGARRDYLARACGGDADLLAEVHSLLEADDAAGQFMQVPPTAAQDGPDPELGKTVGPWKLIRVLGTGGMGRVYLAERDDGAFEKQAAVKLIRMGLDTADVLRRFEQERRVLAGLEHSNIAMLIDGGATAQGVPFLVMEFVEGTPIDRYCDERRLSVDQRLRLFREVCAAVQHAHRNLVVHRDIKPSNILVRGDGSVKLLDFGIAKVLEAGAADSTTHTGTRAMTPRYASPEQMLEKNVTTATDVYSLGVVLFELLTGGRPYSADDLAPRALERVVTEGDPTRPSSAVASSPVAEREGGTRSLAKRLGGDLDTIILTAIRKEPGRRYGSVEQFDEDIRRHLERFPVLARPDTLGYRVTRFVARNRASVLAVGGVVLALIAGTAISTHFALREARQRAIADARFEDVRELATTFLTEVDAAIVGESKTAARERIVSTGLAYLDELAGEAGSDIEVWRDVARGYFRVARIQGDPKAPSLGDAEAALASAAKGQEAAARLAVLDPAGTESRLVEVEGHLLSGDLARHLADADQSLVHFRQALDARQRIADTVPDSDLAEPRLDTVHFRLGYMFERLTLQQQAIEQFQRAWDIEEALIRDHPDKPELFQALAVTLNSLSQSYRFAGQPEKALELLPPLRERLAAEAERHPPLRPVLANLRYNLGWAYADQGELDRGIEEIESVASFYRGLADADPNDTTALRNTAASLHDLGDLEARRADTTASAQHYAELLRMRRQILSRSPDSALFRSDLIAALLAHAEGQVAQGQPLSALKDLTEATTVCDALVAELPEAYHRRSAARVRRRAAAVERALASEEVNAGSKRARHRRAVSLLQDAVAAMRAIGERSPQDVAALAELEAELQASHAELSGA